MLRYDPPRSLDTPDEGDDERTLDSVVVEPALAAARAMLADPRVDRSRVVVVGHSVGALGVLRVALREPRLAGLVLMAAPTRPLVDVLVDQLRYVTSIDGTTTEREAALVADLEQQARRVATLDAPPFPSADELPLGLGAAFWLDLRAHPVATLVAHQRRPMLVMHAGRDYQVTDRDLAGWRRLLAAVPNAELAVYPRLNHLFLPTTEPSSPTEYRLPGHVAEDVLAHLAEWVLQSLP